MKPHCCCCQAAWIVRTNPFYSCKFAKAESIPVAVSAHIYPLLFKLVKFYLEIIVCTNKNRSTENTINKYKFVSFYQTHPLNKIRSNMMIISLSEPQGLDCFEETFETIIS